MRESSGDDIFLCFNLVGVKSGARFPLPYAGIRDTSRRSDSDFGGGVGGRLSVVVLSTYLGGVSFFAAMPARAFLAEGLEGGVGEEERAVGGGLPSALL